MPVAYLDVPSGLAVDIKNKLVTEVTESLDRAYTIPDNRVFLREWTAEQVAVDGELGRPMRTICTFFVRPGLPVEGKRELSKRVSSAMAEACDPPREEVFLPSGTKVSTR
jgi:phenylpyruvate tautomerase PptA (4-oxalocrotonate tautomerase family)